MPGAIRDWILPPREGGPIGLSCCTVHIACHGEAASPGVGRAVYPTILEGFLYLSAGIAVIGKIGPTCKVSSSTKKWKRPSSLVPLPRGRGAEVFERNAAISLLLLCWRQLASRERAVQTEGVGVSPHCSVALPSWVPMQPARTSLPLSATSCSAAQSPRQYGSGLQPHGQRSPSSLLPRCMQISCWQTTGVVLGSLPHSVTACGRDSGSWSSPSSGWPTAAHAHSQDSPHHQRTSLPE